MTSRDGTPPDRESESHELQIDRSAARCFALFCEAERTPEWLPECRSARVRRWDDRGLPAVADYMAGPARGGYVYAMHYAHDPEGLAVSWESEDPTGTRRVTGSARFLAAGPHACRMLYETAVAVNAQLPEWARQAQYDRPAAEICALFKAWVEKQP